MKAKIIVTLYIKNVTGAQLLMLSQSSNPYCRIKWFFLTIATHIHQLRSATSRTCVVRRTHSNYGDRCFAAAGLKLWNSLPADLRQADISFQRFKRLLKTFLFGCCDRSALWLITKPHLISFLTYLDPKHVRIGMKYSSWSYLKRAMTQVSWFGLLLIFGPY